MKYILLLFTIFILTSCGSPDNVVDNRDAVCDIDESELPIIETEVVVTETEIVYVDRPLGVTEDELKFYIWYTFQVVEDLEEDGHSFELVDDEELIVRITNDEGTTDYTLDEYLSTLYDYYDYRESWD